MRFVTGRVDDVAGIVKMWIRLYPGDEFSRG